MQMPHTIIFISTCFDEKAGNGNVLKIKGCIRVSRTIAFIEEGNSIMVHLVN
jgi:hypothetical protein